MDLRHSPRGVRPGSSDLDDVVVGTAPAAGNGLDRLVEDLGVLHLEFTADGEQLVVTSRSQAWIFEIATGAVVTHRDRRWQWIRRLRDGTFLAATGSSLELWDPATDRRTLLHESADRPLGGVSVSDDERMLLMTCEDRLRVLRLER